MRRAAAALVLAALALPAGCTIDPVARAELSGELTGDAIFQRAGTSDQVSYRIRLAGADGTYDVSLEDGACGAITGRFADAGVVEVSGGAGELRGVTRAWDVAAGDNDVIGRALVAARAGAVVSCGDIFNSD